MLLKNNTAVTIPFQMISSADNASPVTGATVTVTLSANGGAFGSPSGTVTEISNGWYYLSATSGDVGSTNGALLLHATCTGAQNTDDFHQIVTDLPGGSVASVTAAVTLAAQQIIFKKNTALNGFTFPMVNTGGAPVTGLTVTAQRSLDGGAVANCANAVTEVGSGLYTINLATTDTNANTIAFIFSASGAQTLFATATTQ